jgi:hypothetical protein
MLQQATGGASASFLLLADDKRRYWCKASNNPSDPKVPVTEEIVGRLGRILGVAVCDVTLVGIPPALAGTEFKPGHRLENGWVHGSLAVEAAVETRSLDHRSENDNPSRHAGFFALYDWLAGQDPQWLIETSASNRYFSHDHGHYLSGPAWNAASLQAIAQNAFLLPSPTQGLSREAIEDIAERLRAVTWETMEGALAPLPRTWQVTDAELESVVEFAFERREDVAARLEALA